MNSYFLEKYHTPGEIYNSWSWCDQAGKPSVGRFDKGKCKVSITKPLNQLALWYPTPGLLGYDHKSLYSSAIIEGSLIYNLKHLSQSTLHVLNYLQLKSDSMLNF